MLIKAHVRKCFDRVEHVRSAKEHTFVGVIYDERFRSLINYFSPGASYLYGFKSDETQSLSLVSQFFTNCKVSQEDRKGKVILDARFC